MRAFAPTCVELIEEWGGVSSSLYAIIKLIFDTAHCRHEDWFDVTNAAILDPQRKELTIPHFLNIVS